MKAIKTAIFTVSLLTSAPLFAGGLDTGAILGGGLGGALGAALGSELGGRNGAILGGALGGATGAAITTKDRDYREVRREVIYVDDNRRRHSRHYKRKHYYRDYDD